MPPVSRIAFALYDLAQEIKDIAQRREPGAELRIEMRMDHKTAEAVIAELRHHHGADPQKDSTYRDPLGKAWKYAGMRLVALPPGNRDA